MKRSLFSSTHFVALIGIAAFTLLMAGCQLGTVQLAGPAAVQPAALPSLGGAVHGGQQAVTGAAIQLYAAGSTGYGTGSSALIATRSAGNQYYAGGQTGCVASSSQVCFSNVVTDGTGSFNITGDYTCPSGSSQMYLVATGGNPGSTGTNAELALIAALGPCSGLTSSTSILINEVTTVAAVTALQQFMTVNNGTPGSFSIGAPSAVYSGVASATQGMVNAFATANVLASSSSGLSVKTAAATIESDKVYTLANVLASCVNTVDGVGSTACSTLFADVKANGSNVAPSDTIQAMYAIATNPVYNVGTIYTLAVPSPAFGGGLSAAPNDFSIALGYSPTYSNSGTTSPAIFSPIGVVIDQFGNAWVTSEGSTTFYAVTEVGPTGSLITGPIQTFTIGGSDARTLKTPRFTAIDQSNNAWVPNQGDASTTSGSVAVIPGSSAANVGSFTGGVATTSSNAIGYAAPFGAYATAVDGSNNVYITGSSSTSLSLAQFANAGSTSAVTATGSLGSAPIGIAVDMSTVTGPYVYVVNQTACTASAVVRGTIAEFNGSSISGASAAHVFGTAGSTCTTNATPAITDQFAATTGDPRGVAVDANNNLWVADNAGGVIGATYLVTGRTGSAASTGNGTIGSTSTSSTTFAAGSPTYGLTGPWDVAVDGNNNAWVVSSTGTSIAELAVSTASGSPVITPLTGNTGLVHSESGSKFSGNRQVAIDASGNIWTSNSTSGGVPYVTVVVGVAAPVVTPIAVALKNNRIGQRP